MAKRILLIADDPGAFKRRAGLDGGGFVIIGCKEVEAAMAVLAYHPIDCVISDLWENQVCETDMQHFGRYVSAYFPKTVTIFIVPEQAGSPPNQRLCGGISHWLSSRELIIVKQIVDGVSSHSGLGLCKNDKAFQEIDRLDALIESNTLVTSFQPILDIQNGSGKSLLGFESLMRAPKGNPVLEPELLFTYAAKKEMLFQTDKHCIKNSLMTADGLLKTGKIFINVRPRSLLCSRFVEDICGMLEQTNISKQDIVLELTEQQKILNKETFLGTLKALREQNFQIALDDFGIGYANIQLIQDIRPDFIKLSGVFCRDLQFDVYKQEIVRATCSMADRMGFSTVLENIETKQELEMARSLGVKYGQGYYFSPPLLPEEFKDSEWKVR